MTAKPGRHHHLTSRRPCGARRRGWSAHHRRGGSGPGSHRRATDARIRRASQSSSAAQGRTPDRGSEPFTPPHHRPGRPAAPPPHEDPPKRLKSRRQRHKLTFRPGTGDHLSVPAVPERLDLLPADTCPLSRSRPLHLFRYSDAPPKALQGNHATASNSDRTTPGAREAPLLLGNCRSPARHKGEHPGKRLRTSGSRSSRSSDSNLAGSISIVATPPAPPSSKVGNDRRHR